MKTILLNTALWAIRRVVDRYIAGGAVDRIEQLCADLLDPRYSHLFGKTKAQRVEEQIEAEYGHITDLAGSVARGVVELLYLRWKLGG
jgi:hypothetical protein